MEDVVKKIKKNEKKNHLTIFFSINFIIFIFEKIGQIY